MGYQNAACVLPADLLEAIQKHIDGAYMYIPRKEENRKQWGEVTNSKQDIRERNKEIVSQYQDGVAVADIASRNYLSPKTIYKILAHMKHQCETESDMGL